jgi:serine/threonine-protein kinase
MERGREVLVGKLAIGRRVLAREDAVRCFHASGKEPFWELAVREGLLERAQADDLVKTVESGSLICRGKCGGAVTPLDLDAPPATDRCPKCGGPIYVTSKNAAASRETWKDAGSDELKEAIAASRAAPSTNGPKPSPTRPPDLRELALTLPPQRPGPDSLPSAVPIPDPRKKTSAIEVPVAIEEPKKETKPAGAFTPFTIGTYEVLAPIGQGGMGTVFRARHKALNRIVAIKVFRCNGPASEDQRERFDREVKTMAKLDHPGIVRVQGGGVVTSGDYEGSPFYVMEYVAGRHLGEWAREKPRSPGAIASMIARIAGIVDFLHARKVIHRDLKPQNVIVSNEADEPKLCDFGLARIADSKLTLSGDIMGTPQFMPPEQALGKRGMIFTGTDIYSLGGMAYYLLTGEPPFDFNHALERGKLVDLMDRISKVPAARPSAKNPAVPPALEAIVLKCLEKEPVKRFHSAKELAVALAGLNLPL